MATVNLSYFKVKNGYAIYLDIITSGKRKRENTGLRVKNNYAAPLRHKSTGKILKDANGQTKYPKIEIEDKEAIEVAEKLATKKRNQLVMQEEGLPDKSKRNANFITFFEGICKEKNNNSYDGALWNLKQYQGAVLPFKAVNYEYISRLQKALSQRVSNKTANTYIQRLRIAWNEAQRLGYTNDDPFRQIRNLKVIETKLRYLELHELEALINCETSVPNLIRLAFIFSCFTGLRFGDIKKLEWNHIHDDHLEKVMDKGKVKILKVPLHQTAKDVLSTLDKSKNMVFHKMYSHSYTNQQLKIWAKDAGINKPLGYHFSRHTFGGLANYIGVDIYTVKELLGHSSIKHTMIYTTVLDDKKTEAINMLPMLKIKLLKRV